MRIRPLAAHTKEDLLRELHAQGWANPDEVATTVAHEVFWVSGLAPEEMAFLRQTPQAGVHVLVGDSAPAGAALLSTTYAGMLALADAATAHGLHTLATALHRAYDRLTTPPPPLRIGPLACEWGTRTYVMGILNATPDSFSGDGLLQAEDWVQAAVERARLFVKWGADILDVGGESTRPGAQPVDEETELARVVPVVQAIAQEVEVAISVDTYKARVAAAALEAGAHMVNDVWGLRMDPDMARVVADYGVPVVIMHNRSRPKNAVQEAQLGGRYVGVEYAHLLNEILDELEASIEIALAAGIPEEHIIIDPGVGFGKTVEQNLELVDRLDAFRALGRPILLGTSRKSFIGYTLDLPPDERVEGTAATVAIGIARGADIVRVHDVLPMVRVARMTDALVRRRR